MAGKWKQVETLLGVGAAVKLVPCARAFGVLRRARRQRAASCWNVQRLALALLRSPSSSGRCTTVSGITTGNGGDRACEARARWWLAGCGTIRSRSSSLAPTPRRPEHHCSRRCPTLSASGPRILWVSRIAYSSQRHQSDVASVFSALTVLIGFGSVYSPQYLLWVIALGSAALARTRVQPPRDGVLGVAVGLAHIGSAVVLGPAVRKGRRSSCSPFATCSRSPVGWPSGAGGGPATRRPNLVKSRHPLGEDDGHEPGRPVAWRIDADDCVMQGTDVAADCVVTFLCTGVTRAGLQSSTWPRSGRFDYCTRADWRPRCTSPKTCRVAPEHEGILSSVDATELKQLGEARRRTERRGVAPQLSFLEPPIFTSVELRASTAGCSSRIATPIVRRIRACWRARAIVVGAGVHGSRTQQIDQQLRGASLPARRSITTPPRHSLSVMRGPLARPGISARVLRTTTRWSTGILPRRTRLVQQEQQLAVAGTAVGSSSVRW
jgi:hypothetical protein